MAKSTTALGRWPWVAIENEFNDIQQLLWRGQLNNYNSL
jgi:hypothetical protein